MRSILKTMALVSFAALAAGCGAKGDQCDVCSNDNDCKGGRTCEIFLDGMKRCASGPNDTCRMF